MLCFSSNITYLAFTFQRPSDGNNNDSLLLFDGLWTVKARYIVLKKNFNIFFS